jgi:hypothetical protein
MTQPARASSLATANDRVEERMALTELNQETSDDGAIKPTEASLKVTVSADSWAEVTEGTILLGAAINPQTPTP